MTAAMDSPDRNLIMRSSDIQGSPFFHFLCSLSPIKPVKIGHGAQTFSELSFPPPPAVFVSPKTDNQRENARSKRRILEGETQVSYYVEDKSEVHDVVESSSEHVCDVEKNSLSWRQAVNGHQRIAVAAGNHSIMPCGASETTQNGSSKPEMKVSQCSTKGTVDCKFDYSVTSTNGQPPMWDVKCLTSQDSSVAHVKEAPSQGSSGICTLPYNNVKAGGGYSEETFNAHSSFHGNQVKMIDQCTQSLSCQNLPDKDRDPSYLSSNDLEKMATSWSLPVEYLSKILASMNGTTDREDQSTSFELDFPQASNEPSNLQGGEEIKAENMNHGTKATITGVRRRCLDFETPETQQRALDNLPMLKMIDLTSENPSDNVLAASNLEANRESASSENDAVHYSSESQNSNAWDHGMHSFSNLHVLPGYARMLNPSNASYLPSQQNPIINSGAGLGCSLPSKMPSTIENKGSNGGALPYSARVLPLSGSQGSSSENEQNHLQSRNYMQTGYSSNLDQELLLSLVNRARMIQRDLMMPNTAAEIRMARPSTFHPSVGLGIHPIEEDIFPGESHQSESDYQEESALSPSSPTKKRKLFTQTGDNTGESCKNCKCKKSKCLKLYCECFAAGVYCIDICNCIDCYNKPEYEEMVLGTRQQIESRNPLAFLPKIIRTTETSPTIGEEISDTPASARHKRGCHCKKSQCLKKYCECYQAGVGCADGCRCEGCKNIYGRNEGSGELEEKDQQNAFSEMNITTNDESTDKELTHSPDHPYDQQSFYIHPITPYLENAGKPSSDVELVSAKRLTSTLENPASTESLQSQSRLLELLEETENFGHLNLQPYQTAYRGAVPHHQLSPGWHGQTKIYTPPTPAQPLQQPPPMLTDVLLLRKSNACEPSWQTHDNSPSNMGSYVPSSTNPEIQSSLINQQMFPLNFSPETSQVETPENAFAIPATPLLLNNYALRPNSDYEELSENQSHQSVWLTDEEDSPSVLRELNTFSGPSIIMKTRSPKQKRIFLYQRSTGLTKNISPGLGSKKVRWVL